MSLFNKKKRHSFQTVGDSALHCCVPLCTGSSRYNLQISFHTFPSKNHALREQWLVNIRRDFTPSKGSRVCSRHFLPGDIVQKDPGRKRRLKTGAVPVLFHWNHYTPPKAAADTEDRAPALDHIYCVPHVTGPEQSTSWCVELLQSRAQALLLGSRAGLERYAGADSDVRYYTRFASYQHFQYFWSLIEPAVKTKMTKRDPAAADSVSCPLSTKLPPIDELFMFLMYLSVGLPLQDLAERFGVPVSAVSKIISAWTHFLYQLLGGTCLWLPREVVRAHLPPEFGEFSDTQVVLDCTEISCQTPADPLVHTEVFSTYRSHSTLKALVGMAPHGAVTFVSPLYAGSMSDCEIFKQSGISRVLTPDMAIMVHRGFLIDHVAPCRVHRPAYLSGQTQRTQSIMRLRVYMERCLRRLKEYGVFDRTTHAPVCESIEEMFHVACYLLNYQSGPLVKQ